MTSSFISDSKIESMDAKCHMAHSDMKGGTSALQPEASTSAEELEQLHGKEVTAANIKLERMRCNFVLTKLKYEHEDNEKQRLHEGEMEPNHHQRSVRRERGFNTIETETFTFYVKQFLSLAKVSKTLNQYALFLYCFLIIHVIYTVKELTFYFFQTHYLFCFAIVLFFILKKIFQDYKNKKSCS